MVFGYVFLTFVTMRKLYFAILLFIGLMPAKAQFVKIGNGDFGLGTIAGPLNVSTNFSSYYSRFAYIYPASVLGNLQHGDSIISLEFMRTAGLGLNSGCNLSIYLKNTSADDFDSGALYWPTEISNATMVYSQNPSGDIGEEEGFHKIPFNNKIYVFDTTKGFNLELLVQYEQNSTQSQTISWYFEGNFSVPGLTYNQTKSMNGSSLQDSLKNSSEYHPTIIFNYPRFNNDVMVQKLYSLGKMPVPLGNPDSVKVLVRNTGKKTLDSVQIITWMKGPNKGQIDTATIISNIAPGEERFLNIPSLFPLKKGIDTVFAKATGDMDSTNNTVFSYRLENENIYSYRDISEPPAGGGIGFNGTTGDFVARFQSNQPKSLNQVSVNFAITGRPFRIGIWDNSRSGGLPGNLIYLSDSLISTAGVYILDLKKPVSVNGTFYVGVRQLNTNNVAFGYQMELPVRPNTFFFASPAKDTNWIDFAPDAPFRFLIEPRIQGDTDLTVLSADFPRDTIDRYTTDTLAPKATVANIGAKDMHDSFDITCEILVFGKVVYKQTLRDTLSSGQKRVYTFPKTFWPADFGEHQMRIYTNHPKDQIIDNDTGRRNFYVGVKNDVFIPTVYDPPNQMIYEYLLDTFMPVATVQNPSYNNTKPFTARCKILKGSTVLYNQTQTLSLPKFQSRILAWPTYKCNDTGRLTVIFTVEMAGDVARQNDTQTRSVFVVKYYDLGVDSILIPAKNVFHKPGANMKPLFSLYNDGILGTSTATAYCAITSKYSAQTYYDTVTFSILGHSKTVVEFNRNFKPIRKGLYTIRIKVKQDGDRVKFNDSFKHDFHVGNPYDYRSMQLLYPLAKDSQNVGGAPVGPRIKINNNGYLKNSDVVPVICQIWKGSTMVYNNIKSLNLDTGAIFDLDFTASFIPQNAGLHRVIAYTNYVSDVQRNNDTVTGTFWVSVGKDAFVQSIDTPLFSDLYFAKTSSIQPSATVSNQGKLTMKNVKVYAEIYKNKQLLYDDVVTDSLMGLETKKLQFSKSFVPPDSGTYSIWVRTFAMDDQYIFNDTLKGSFTVGKTGDVAAISWIYPAPLQSIVNTSGAALPSISLKYVGTDTAWMQNGDVYFEIFNSSSTLVYSDTGKINGVGTLKSDTVQASKTWPFFIPGNYTIRAVVKAQNDLFEYNDTILTGFAVVTNTVRSVAKESVSIYPVPVKNSLHVQSSGKVLKAWVYSASGQKFELTEISASVYNTAHLPAGNYFLHLTFKDSTEGLKFIKLD